MKKIYILSIIISIFLGTLVFTLGINVSDEKSVRWIVFVPLFLFVFGFIGLTIPMDLRKEKNFFWWMIFPGLIAVLLSIL